MKELIGLSVIIIAVFFASTIDNEHEAKMKNYKLSIEFCKRVFKTPADYHQNSLDFCNMYHGKVKEGKLDE